MDAGVARGLPNIHHGVLGTQVGPVTVLMRGRPAMESGTLHTWEHS